MPPEVISAIVSGVFAIIAPIITYTITKYFEHRAKLPISSRRRQVITGIWQGRCYQPNVLSHGDVEFDAIFNLQANSKIISGTMTLKHDVPELLIEQTFTLQGGFHYGKFLQLDYQHKSNTTIQFGSVILNLNSAGDALEGKYVGYGALTQEVIWGAVKLRK